jgi:hypothetical protein
MNYSTENSIRPKDGKSETISQLARRHLLNQYHTTTDEEIKNARIEFNDNFDASVEDLSNLSNVDNNTVLPPLSYKQNGGDINDESSDSNTDQKSFPNPYNVLG